MSFSLVMTAAADVDADEAFRRLKDLEDYPRLTTTVLEVIVTGEGDLKHSSWRVAFRGGILCWSEEDRIDTAARVLTFRLLSGDVDCFDGYWRVDPDAAGCLIQFASDVDLGIASLAAVVDPVAKTTLHEVIMDILTGLFPGARLVTSQDVASVPS